jgi:hypothetical protein
MPGSTVVNLEHPACWPAYVPESTETGPPVVTAVAPDALPRGAVQRRYPRFDVPVAIHAVARGAPLGQGEDPRLLAEPQRRRREPGQPGHLGDAVAAASVVMVMAPP